MEKKSKAKLIWTVTNNGCEKLGVESIAATIVQNHLSAVRMSYTSSSLPNILKLREELTRQLGDNNNSQQHSEGCIPFFVELYWPSRHFISSH